MDENGRKDNGNRKRWLQECGFDLEKIQEEAERLAIENETLKSVQESLLAGVSLGFVAVDLTGKVLSSNCRLLEILGSQAPASDIEIDGFTFPPLVESGISEMFRICLEEGRFVKGEKWYAGSSGKRVFLRKSLVPLRDGMGNICGCQAAIEDVTEQKLAEEALRESEERYRLLAQNSLTGIYIHQDGLFVYVNDRLASMMGYSVEDMVGRKFWDFVHPSDRVLVKQRGLARSLGESVQPLYEFRALCKDGSTKWFEVMATSIMYRGRTANMGNVADITERKKADRALLESRQEYRDLYEESRSNEELYRTLLNASPAAVVVYDLDGRVRYVNDSFTRLFGWTLEEIRGKRVPYVPESEAEVTTSAISAALEDGALQSSFETKRQTKDGRILEVNIRGSRYHDYGGNPQGLLVVLDDTTERKRLEEQLRQAARMQAIGQLAGGVAHDFNNLLTGVMGYSSILLQQMGDDNPHRDKIAQISRAAERATGLTRQLLAFGRKQMLDVRVVDLNAAVTEFEPFLRRLIGEDIEFETVLGASLGRVRADPGQLEQIIMNLAVNARDAMPSGGKMTIETADVRLDEEYARTHPEVEPGPYVMLAVSDTGRGMKQETLERIFDPFFTTKEKGIGTGLGLSTVYGIVKQHHGHISVYSEIGRGTVFKVFLARVEDPVEQVPKPAATMPRKEAHEWILVVEDEEIVRHLACEALTLLGYSTLAAGDPEEALKVCDTHPGTIHLLLTDVVLPRMDGRTLFGLLSAQRPELRVLYVSGYTENFIVRRGVLDRNVHFMQKPFTVEDLALKVRQVLDE
jgi:two-component system, cell cycle sensor histidine kinase and response regulator CckA